MRYLAVELLTAFLVAACFLQFGLTADAFVAAFFCSVLVVLSAIDVERHILPDRIVLPSAALILAAQLVLHPDQWLEWVLAPLGAAAFLFAALLAYPKGMGMGDVKLCLLLGAMLGKLVLVSSCAFVRPRRSPGSSIRRPSFLARSRPHGEGSRASGRSGSGAGSCTCTSTSTWHVHEYAHAT